MTRVGTVARYLAIDGGNSKTDVVVGTGDGKVLGYARGGGTNHQNVSMPETLSRLRALVTQARADAGMLGHDTFDHAEVYLAGADLPAEVDLLTTALAAEGWAPALHLDNDTFALLRAGTDATEAVAVEIGRAHV